MARRPVNAPYTITTQFGVPDNYAKFGRHSGVDYAVPLNRPVYAPVSGQLTNIVSPTGGNMVQIFDGKYYHRLMHNNSFSRGNGPVNEGNEVAKAGTTGLSTGVHSHWDVATKATPTSFADFIDPNAILNNQGGSAMGVPNEDGWYSRFRQLTKQIRGRDMSREEFAKNIVPARDPFNAVEILSDNPEAHANTEFADYGRRSRQESWEDRTKLLEQDRDNNLYPLIEAMKKQLADSNAMVDTLKAKAYLSDTLQAKVEELTVQNEKLVNREVEANKTGNAFIQWIGNLFNNFRS